MSEPFETSRNLLGAVRLARQWTVAARFTTLVRLLLAAAFLPSGAKKVMGHRFTQISVDVPIGSFFEAFFQAQEYYVFVGLAQVLAALLLLWPRTALLGALLFLPIISNIVMITWSLQFPGTVFVTVALLMGTLYLLLWDAHRLAPLLSAKAVAQPLPPPARRVRLRTAIGATVAFGLAGLGVAALLAQGPGQQAGALLLVVGAMLLPLCLAAALESAALLLKPSAQQART